MRLAVVAALSATAGCRLGFQDHNLGVLDAGAASDAHVDATSDAPGDARIVTLTFGERAGSMTTGVTVDGSLTQDLPAMNWGVAEDLSIAAIDGFINRGAIRFDVSSIAPGTLVVAARLELARIDYGDETAGMVGVRLAGEPWVESTATWNEYDTGLTWTTPGGDPSATLLAATSGAPAANAFAIAIPVATVQGWVDAPATNLGLLLVAADEAVSTHYHVHSSESATLTERPLLVIDVAQ